MHEVLQVVVIWLGLVSVFIACWMQAVGGPDHERGLASSFLISGALLVAVGIYAL